MPPLASTPQWFTSVMGTAIVATASSVVPYDSAVLTDIADGFWLLAWVLLGAALVHTVVTYARDHTRVRRELDSPAIAPFFGAPAMALLAVGGATLLVGPRFLGQALAVQVDVVLWTLGTVLGLVVAVIVPARQFTTHRVGTAAASPAWLLPLVSPMVSAATGAMLVDHVATPSAAHALAFASMAMFGASGLAAGLATASLWWRLAHHQHGEAATVPTLWIVLGPLGQSVTAVTALAIHAGGALPGLADVMPPAAVLYGIPVMGFALLWLTISMTVAVRVTGRRLPYTMAWWSFTFPVGTCVTGAAGLATITGSAAIGGLAITLLLLLLAGWVASAWGTLRALREGRAATSPTRARAGTSVV